MKLTNNLKLYYWYVGNNELVISLEDITMLYDRPPKQLIFKFYKNYKIKLRNCSGNPLIFNLKKYEKKADV